MTIFVVDPVEHDLNYITKLLDEWGYSSHRSYASESEALEMLGLLDTSDDRAVYGLELFIIDISQGGEYPNLLRKIHECRAYSDIPILVLADGPRQENISTAFAYGAHDFMSKPLEEHELRARVRSSLKFKYEIDRRKAREHELIEATHQLSDLNQILSKLSLMDSLTGIPNRRCFDETLDLEWRRALRYGGKFTVIMIDIDHFKLYNDTYGHQKGDHCIRQVAKTIHEELRRPGDLLARYGGEEFVVILPSTTAKSVEPLSQKILRSVEALQIPHESSKTSDFVTISMGIASLDPKGSRQSAQDLVLLADQALYQAKAKGRNQVVIHAASSEEKAG